MTTSRILEPVVIRQLERKSAFERITSNGTIAAAAMVGAALVALVLANTPLYEPIQWFFEQSIRVGLGKASISISVEALINDGLMAIFFLLVGIELKYEMTVGQLKHLSQAALPMLAAVGGVCAPALIYLAINWGTKTTGGWAVPIATDIAFALGVASLLGDRISPTTKVFFQTLAIADDILAIVVIALFYGQVPDLTWCIASLVAVGLLVYLNRTYVYSLWPYTIVGVLLWVCMYNSGIHATLAGVIIAFTLPARSDVRLTELGSWLGNRAEELDETYDEDRLVLGQHGFMKSAVHVERVLHHVTPPLERMARHISVTVNFLILPVFAFANAGVHLVGTDFAAIVANPVTQGVYLGAVFGKPLGIVAVTAALVLVGFAKLPRGMDWVQVVAVGIMSGLGFTMSILISGLAFTSAANTTAAKCAIILGSFTSAVAGIAFVRIAEVVRGPGGKRAEASIRMPKRKQVAEPSASAPAPAGPTATSEPSGDTAAGA